MSIQLAIPKLEDLKLFQFFRNILAKAVDGTRVPLVVDDVNQRVLIGTAVAQTSNNGKLEVSGGDIRVVNSGSGVIMASANGTVFRVSVDNNGALSADPL